MRRSEGLGIPGVCVSASCDVAHVTCTVDEWIFRTRRRGALRRVGHGCRGGPHVCRDVVRGNVCGTVQGHERATGYAMGVLGTARGVLSVRVRVQVGSLRSARDHSRYARPGGSRCTRGVCQRYPSRRFLPAVSAEGQRCLLGTAEMIPGRRPSSSTSILAEVLPPGVCVRNARRGARTCWWRVPNHMSGAVHWFHMGQWDFGSRVGPQERTRSVNVCWYSSVIGSAQVAFYAALGDRDVARRRARFLLALLLVLVRDSGEIRTATPNSSDVESVPPSRCTRAVYRTVLLVALVVRSPRLTLLQSPRWGNDIFCARLGHLRPRLGSKNPEFDSPYLGKVNTAGRPSYSGSEPRGRASRLRPPAPCCVWSSPRLFMSRRSLRRLCHANATDTQRVQLGARERAGT